MKDHGVEKKSKSELKREDRATKSLSREGGCQGISFLPVDAKTEAGTGYCSKGGRIILEAKMP